MASLNSVTSPLTARQVSHLLRRATVGVSTAKMRSWIGLTPQAALERLFAEQPLLPAPLDPATGKTFVDIPFSSTLSKSYLKGWWVGQMLTEQVSVREKMVLFWQNHFVTTLAEVDDYRYFYYQNLMLRRNALGNFRTFIIEVTKDPAMLRYLNGNQNVAGKPNENYARELLELFTIGRNNYTEDDVKAAARVLTGWADSGFRSTTTATITTSFRANQHDTTNKQFSTFFQNTLIQGKTGATAGEAELGSLIDMILAQPETARFICRKLYRWFLNADISPDVEQTIIEPLAKIFRGSNYEIKPVVSALLTSQHFYEESLRGSIIKSPVELVIGAWRAFEMPVPDLTKEAAVFYTFTNYLLQRTKEQQQDLLDQPSVFGYKPYYDTGFSEIWINASTLALRGNFTDQLINGRITINNVRQYPDLIKIAGATTAPTDVEKLINELAENWFAVDLTKQQKDYMIDQIMVPGLPRYVWSDEWNNYKNDPTSTNKRMAIQTKLVNLMLYMFRLAEYQMV
ncbi:DUF1800 domain-containing protein [Tellurirhabdus bombi]|uniref:DUF1800 domain-containing protein n=1 Tax=Tellurirhabdus bombi TaxID=2907205 RepID=UPI001F431A6C|nr:DUF1800 domain-containing protein [Tellurirhabdus bombi]